MTRCNHISWLDLVEGEAGPHILHGWCYSQILQSFQNPSEQCPQTILLLGKKEKDIALRRLCKSRDRSRVPGSISIRADGSSERSQYPRIFADWNPQSREVRPAFNSPRVCHREENIPVNWPRIATWDPYDLVLSRLLFLFCDIICIFSEDIGGCVTKRVLEEEDFLNNILYSKILSASFTDIKVLSLPSNDNVTIQPEYLDNLISRSSIRGNSLDGSFTSYITSFLSLGISAESGETLTQLHRYVLRHECLIPPKVESLVGRLLLLLVLLTIEALSYLQIIMGRRRQERVAVCYSYIRTKSESEPFLWQVSVSLPLLYTLLFYTYLIFRARATSAAISIRHDTRRRKLSR
ncbi:hypothetical protein TEQG_03074 [Trichophyton equinum CBS 127.97]|uniref:Uncharacterized protein n=1 Tax=Trichophyton equinum (strain ATCC MYA-4606 / CBS 127.97) TaxID=559882 RepID=F2PQ72_TRIEC|nr:hypothetical protein TEQG_03074 [Trichophyton equinum CBS 127.97]